MAKDHQKEIFAKNLNHYLKINGLQQKDVAKSIGVLPSTFNTWCTGQAMPRTGAISSLIEYFNIQTSDLMDEHNFTKKKVTGVKIPVLGYVAAGIPIEEIEEILDYEEIDEKLSHTGTFFGLKIKGNSMEPHIYDGDVVIIKSQPDIESGSIGIVSIKNQNATCKKIIKSNEGVQLVSFNTAYDPVFYNNKQVIEMPVTVLGKVIELRRKF